MATSTHGIDYHASFLDSLPTLNAASSSPSSSTAEQVPEQPSIPTRKKIRALTASQFASLHLKHILAHPPDTVLFPFLHGLEGDNEAQNLFFGVDETSETPVPRYRGLVWVVCEEDLTPDQRRKLFKRRNLDPQSPAASEPASSSKQAKKRREGGDVIMGTEDSSESEDLDDDDFIGSDDLDYEDDEDDESLYSDDLDEGFADEDVVPYEEAGAYLRGDGKEVVREVQIDDKLVSEADPDEDSDASSPSSEGMQVTPLMPCAPPLPPVSNSTIQSPVLGALSGNGDDGMDIDVEMDIDSGVVAVGVGLQGMKKPTEANREEGTHMHPVAQRQGRHTQSLFEDAIPTPLSIPVTSPPSSQSSQQSLASHAISSTPPPSHHALTSQPSQSSLPTSVSIPQTPSRSRPKRSRTPPLLTSSFRPSELLKRVADSWESVTNGSRGADKWDFIPLKVPDGISLRNFGIQVPVYATLSDIVVYSPKGASPAALALAKRFSEAIERKRTWRRERAEEVRRKSGEIPRDGEDDEGRFLEYNVFVLDADADALRKELPHLVVRVCAPGGILSPEKAKTHDDSASRSSGTTSVLDDRHHDAGAHTIGSDGRVDAMDVFDCEVEDAASKPSAHTLDPDTNGTGVLIDGLLSNTVDFALREKEEMRDLTRASEIITVYPSSDAPGISVHTSRKPLTVHHAGGTGAIKDDGPIPWSPELGQVFLGNADDVPLMRNPDGPMMHFHSGGPGRKGLAGDGLDLFGGSSPESDVDMHGETSPYGVGADDPEAEGVEEDLPEDDPFNYLPTNDPGRSMGYDICFECHDRAPYPSPAHLRAAEEHLGMLEVMWARRCMEKENTRIQRSRSHPNWKSRRSEAGKAIPPRPPPNANAVIHLPFPSSPPFNSSRMSSLMSVLDFIEKWLQPPTTPVVLAAPTHTADSASADGLDSAGAKSHGRRWSTVSSIFPSFGPAGSSFFPSASPSTSEPTTQAAATPVPAARNRSFTSPPTPHIPSDHRHEQHGTSSNAQYTRTSGQACSPSPSTAISAHTLSFSTPPNSPLTRPLKILIYSNDGYTESSGAALSLLMKLKGLKLPEAYLDLQVTKRRSFFVYGDDLGILRKVEQRITEEHERERRRRDEERERERQQERQREEREKRDKGPAHVKQADDKHAAPNGNAVVGRADVKEAPVGNDSRRMMGAAAAGRRPAAKSVSFAQAPVLLPPPHSLVVPPTLSSISASGTTTSTSSSTPTSHNEDADHSVPSSVTSTMITPINIATPGPSTASIAGPTATSAPTSTVPSSGQHTPGNGHGHVTFGHSQVIKGRPRANTSPWLPSLFGDHQSWFNDPRFDGSFPSRVLPFLYLGNLNHASNAYMLHALGITHVVSVGECALIPPPHLNNYQNNAHCTQTSLPNSSHFVPGKGHGGQGSLWTEEREGRIKVLDIKGICDDGIDTLEPQLEPICEWIDRARAEGGRVLVHCRVGVSRSATVVIAYVMKHLHLPLVDAYLIVRSRRLSVLIQPNMRLLYNLCGWEIKLAKERAGEDEKKLIAELSRAVSWPWLAKEVHKLNEKYITA
ncbi:tyrosine/serine/threonine protein phosphatase pps1 [Pleurotus ostreatus]|uniref:Tyrosine/serine/threonine protein phosphatase pps1 n=1 Tax=Pleurotus ostreatus TaxID=5322 RepID=A0A8H7DQH0_PLEOS|nr:tyrosine/serine/threonine protein phosphatase pps1 [Pleurotus ostreatus]KAF7423928.1 tyrosine/serine/threonine protein phosphatase pps1 [Pleurotus ostreatus]KAJ8693273.1 tyrosine/serine/threonine protein phosphatase pps1 [Pleurotus ostreatus]